MSSLELTLFLYFKRKSCLFFGFNLFNNKRTSYLTKSITRFILNIYRDGYLNDHYSLFSVSKFLHKCGLNLKKL
jgi:hypothetical protein